MKPPKVIAAPTAEPVSVDEARLHIEAQRYDDSTVDDADDDMISAWISAAREHCENFLGLSLATTTLEVALDEFPDGAIDLPRGPVREIVSVTVGDASDNELDAGLYTLDDYSVMHRAVPVDEWPSMTAATNTVKVRYLAGYGVDSDGGQPLPRAIRAAILLMVGHLYAHREDGVDKAMQSLPNGAEALMRPLRVRLGMA